jgi:glycosyltransferase involved in cell wall biosynthesis
MKVCQIMAGDEEGGLENHFVELCNGLSDKVDEVVVIAHEKYRERFRPEIRFLPLDLSGGRRNPWLLFRLARLIRKEAPDIVHAQANKAVDMLARIRAFIPSYRIGTLHGRKKNLDMYARMQTVIGVSRGVVDGIEHPDVRVIYNGIQPYTGTHYDKRRLAAEYQLNPKLPIAIAVGRLVPVKGFQELIRAWPAGKAQLLIVGDGPERESLQALIVSRRLEQQIVLAGYRADARGLMTGTDLLLVSSHREGFNYTVAEALTSGIPVLSTQVPVAREILPEPYLVPVGDLQALSLALERVLNNPGKIRADQLALFDWAREVFTIDHMVAHTTELYREQLQQVK